MRLIKALLAKYFTPKIMKDEYKFSESGLYYSIEKLELLNIKEYIKSLPLDDDPEVFGLHSNANITFQSKTVKSPHNFIFNYLFINKKGIHGNNDQCLPASDIKQVGRKSRRNHRQNSSGHRIATCWASWINPNSRPIRFPFDLQDPGDREIQSIS